MEAETIIAKLIDRYRGVKTYQNAGFTQNTSDDCVSRYGFRTYFERPSNYRFDWWSEYQHPSETKNASNSGQIWSNSRGSFVRYRNEAYSKRRNLKTALSSVFTEQDPARLVMGLLLPEVVQFEHCIHLMKEGELKPKQSSTSFYQICFRLSPEAELELYIHESNFSLVRARRMSKFQITEKMIDLFETAPDDTIGISKEVLLADMRLRLNVIDESIEDHIFEEQFFDQRIWGSPFTGLPIERK